MRDNKRKEPRLTRRAPAPNVVIARSKTIGTILSDANKKEKKVTKGARSMFLEKYRVTGDINSAKKELDDNGFKSNIYEDNVYQTWIDEDRVN